MKIFQKIGYWLGIYQPKTVNPDVLRYTGEHWDAIAYMIDDTVFSIYHGKPVRISFSASLELCKNIRDRYIANPNIFIFQLKHYSDQFIDSSDQFIKDNPMVNPRDMYFFDGFVYVKDEKLASYLLLNGEKMLPMHTFKETFPELFENKL